jgi:hypothetical protein
MAGLPMHHDFLNRYCKASEEVWSAPKAW